MKNDCSPIVFTHPHFGVVTTHQLFEAWLRSASEDRTRLLDRVISAYTTRRGTTAQVRAERTLFLHDLSQSLMREIGQHLRERYLSSRRLGTIQ